MRKYLAYLLLASSALSGCAQKPSYAESLSLRPKPTSAQEMQSECGWIRQEMVRMQTMGDYASGIMNPMLAKAIAQKNIASLEARAANIGCRSAFSSVVVEMQGSGNIGACISACLEHTGRTSEQCFDSCNK